jgi:hypothetical protein
MNDPRLWLTSMSSDLSEENARETIEPILPWLDGVVYVQNNVSREAPSSIYLESVKGDGKIIYRDGPVVRHSHIMNETLFTDLIQEGEFCIWADPLERPDARFISRVKHEVIPMMNEADLDVLFYYGKAYLFRYRETLEYRNTPHWTLTGWNGRAIEWSTIEPDEGKVRLNVRPFKRTDKHHFVLHYARYYVSYPAGSNTCALGLEQHPGGATQEVFARREGMRLAFRKEMKRRGVPLTVGGLKTLLTGPLDDTLKAYLRGEKILSDAYHLFHGRTDGIKDNHNPADALPII